MKKERTESINRQQKTLERLATRLEPPIDLDPEETVAFDQIIDGLPQESWDPYRLRLAAQLARLTLYNEALMIELLEEGPTQKNDRNTLTANPKQSAMNQNQSTIGQLIRVLGVSASQRGISASTTAASKAAEKTARSAIKTASRDDLLA